jgi:hypothetical protein
MDFIHNWRRMDILERLEAEALKDHSTEGVNISAMPYNGGNSEGSYVIF